MGEVGFLALKANLCSSANFCKRNTSDSDSALVSSCKTSFLSNTAFSSRSQGLDEADRLCAFQLNIFTLRASVGSTEPLWWLAVFAAAAATTGRPQPLQFPSPRSLRCAGSWHGAGLSGGFCLPAGWMGSPLGAIRSPRPEVSPCLCLRAACQDPFWLACLRSFPACALSG